MAENTPAQARTEKPGGFARRNPIAPVPAGQGTDLRQFADPGAASGLLNRVDAGQRARLLLRMQGVYGNAFVGRLIEAGAALRSGAPSQPSARATTAARPTGSLQRHTLSEAEREDLKSELKQLNGLSITGLLAAMAKKDGDERQHLVALAPEVAGSTHEQRLRICAKAAGARGTSAASFALANEPDLTAVVEGMGGGHAGQMDAILKFVDPRFSPAATKIKPGEVLATVLGRDGAVARPGSVRVRTSAALTWMAANPGAVGEAPAFKPAGAYSGQTVGGARLSVFPDDNTGQAALLQWIAFWSGRGVTVGGYFHAHAPTAEDLAGRIRKQGREPTDEEMAKFEAATKGNDPERYLKSVAESMGSTADAMRNRPLAAVDASAFAAAIKKEEGWTDGDSLSLEEAGKDSRFAAGIRFRLLYTRLSGGID